jgi:hypothetical protein
MRAALCGEAAHLYRRYSHWNRLLATEIAMARERERLRMAFSQEWSGLGKYVRESLLIARHGILLDMAGLLFRLRIPGARTLFENAIAAILEMVYSAVA